MPDVAAQIKSAGFELGGMPPAQFGDYVKAELAKWGKVIQEAGIKGE